MAAQNVGHTVKPEAKVDGEKKKKREEGEDGNAEYCLLIHTHAYSPACLFLETRLDEILKWLDGLNCAEKQDVTLSLRQPDTCKWLFDTTQYKTWRDGESSFLWLRGKRRTSQALSNILAHMPWLRFQLGRVSPCWRMSTFRVSR